MSQLKGLMVAALLFGVIGIAGAGQALAEETSVAKVGSVVISEDEFQYEIQKRLPAVSFHGNLKPETLEKIRKEAKELLVTRAYKVNYAYEQKLSVGKEAVNADWATFAGKNPGVAKATPYEVEKLKEFRHQDLLAKLAEEQAVDSKVMVSDGEVKKFYEANKSQYFQQKLFKASHIMVKVDPSSNKEQKAALKQKAEKILERAKAGEDFFNLAYYESDDRSKYVGGSLGMFHAGQTVPEFDAEIQKMKAGEIAGPVLTLYGYHIIKLDEVQDARQLSFEQVEDKVRSRLKEDKRKKLYDEWMNALRQKYPLVDSGK